MPSYKLTYFDLRGRAEVSRYIFAVAGVKFEDHRVQGHEWPALKPGTPFGHMPLLEVDGKILSEGNAIARYLAREFGLAGSDSWEQGLCDQYMEVCADLFTEAAKAFFERDETKKAEMMKKFFDETCKQTMSQLERCLRGPYFVGTSLTVADLAVLSIFDSLLLMQPGLLDNHPALKSHRERILQVPSIAAYVKNRKETSA